MLLPLRPVPTPARRLATLGLLFAFLPLAAGGEEPVRITWVIGGAVSGPQRLSADLATGRLEHARASAGARGDGAGLDAWTMPATASHTLSPAQRREIARLAARLAREGAFYCPNPAMLRIVDALGGLEIEQDGRRQRQHGPTACLTPDGAALVQALTCAAGQGCP